MIRIAKRHTRTFLITSHTLSDIYFYLICQTLLCPRLFTLVVPIWYSSCILLTTSIWDTCPSVTLDLICQLLHALGVDIPNYPRSSAVTSLSGTAEDTAYVDHPSSSAQASTSSFEPSVAPAATNNIDEDGDFL